MPELRDNSVKDGQISRALAITGITHERIARQLGISRSAVSGACSTRRIIKLQLRILDAIETLRLEPENKKKNP